jgi:hypothetical protein
VIRLLFGFEKFNIFSSVQDTLTDWARKFNRCFESVQKNLPVNIEATVESDSIAYFNYPEGYTKENTVVLAVKNMSNNTMYLNNTVNLNDDNMSISESEGTILQITIQRS